MKNTLILFTLVILLFSCSKDDDILSENFESSITSRAAQNNSKTIVGNKRENPFTVENFQAAYKELYGRSGRIAATHNYVEFKPSNFEELRQLVSAEVFLYDYPLDHEIIRMGTTINAAVSKEDPGTYYAVLEVNQRVPVKYNVLSPLYLGDDDPRLIEKAYTRMGYDPQVEGYFYDDGPPEPDTTVVDPGPGNDPHFDGDLIVDGNCDCKSGLHTRNPAGCITVEDNRLSNGTCDKAVRHVKVTLKNTWFTEATVYTDKFGCFSRNKKYFGKAQMWVTFQNQHATIRGVEGSPADAYNYALPVTDYAGEFNGPNFNNMDICYTYPTANQGNAYRFWRAATINNGVFEYRDWSSANNLPAPVTDLQVLMTTFDAGAAAPMVDKIYDITGFTLPIDNQYGGIALALPILSGPLLTFYLAAFAPDLVFNNANVPQTNRIKSTIYHELGHAQHFTRLETPDDAVDYWLANINYIVDNQGYGDGTEDGAERTQVIENWATTIGHTVAHDAYGLDASSSHECTLEGLRFISDHIQGGWLHDIHDNIGNECNENSNIIDNVGGYEHSLFLDIMTSDVETPTIFKDEFISTHLDPSDLNAFEILCQGYGL